MGLDNGFIARSKKDCSIEIELLYFRKYYELDRWVKNHCKPVVPDDDSLYYIIMDDIIKLQHEIQNLYLPLSQKTKNEILYYDDFGYPEELVALFYENDFNPVKSKSYAAGYKLVSLYNGLDVMLNIMAFENNKFEFLFYSSY